MRRAKFSGVTKRPLILTILVLLVIPLALWARRERGGWQDRRHGDDRGGVPNWGLDQDLPKDVFTFARVRYQSYSWRDKWATDYPESDYNFSYRLQELTSLEVDPDPAVVSLTDDELFQYPFLYMIEVGDLAFDEAEVDALRSYLLRGGFLMVDDFWGPEEYANFEYELGRVFPNRKLEEIPLKHPIFEYGVFKLDKRPQIPSINAALRGRREGITWEGWERQEPHYQALYDDKGRMMCIVCHNTDLGDGWEREGENHWYFKEFSEKYAYPLGINIVFYALTQ